MAIRFDVSWARTAVVFWLALWTLALAGCCGSSSFSSSASSPPTQPGNPVGTNLTQISSDPYTAAPGQHATEVEPHMLANGNTLVAAFQSGRIAAQEQTEREVISIAREIPVAVGGGRVVKIHFHSVSSAGMVLPYTSATMLGW